MAGWTCATSGILMGPGGSLGCTNEAVQVLSGSSVAPLILFMAIVLIHQNYLKGGNEWPIDVDVMEDEE